MGDQNYRVMGVTTYIILETRPMTSNEIARVLDDTLTHSVSEDQLRKSISRFAEILRTKPGANTSSFEQGPAKDIRLTPEKVLIMLT